MHVDQHLHDDMYKEKASVNQTGAEVHNATIISSDEFMQYISDMC